MANPVPPTPVNPAANPWNQTLANDSAQGQQAIANSQQTTALANQQLSSMGDASAYPAMTNAYGLGSSQSSAIPGSASNPAFGAAPLTIAVPDTASRGFNPWSLTGESNARGK